MKVMVSRLYKNGAKTDKPVQVFTGDLNVSDRLHPELHRLVKEAVLLSASGRHVIDPMIDVQLVKVDAHGMLLRGFDMKHGGEYAQEWRVSF